MLFRSLSFLLVAVSCSYQEEADLYNERYIQAFTQSRLNTSAEDSFDLEDRRDAGESDVDITGSYFISIQNGYNGDILAVHITSNWHCTVYTQAFHQCARGFVRQRENGVYWVYYANSFFQFQVPSFDDGAVGAWYFLGQQRQLGGLAFVTKLGDGLVVNKDLC